MPLTISRRPESASHAFAVHMCLGDKHHHRISCDFLEQCHHHATFDIQTEHEIPTVSVGCRTTALKPLLIPEAYRHIPAHRVDAAHQSL